KESCQQRENSGKFKKGMTPHNKGKKLSDSTKAKLVKTMFKSGNRPHNTLQVGAETQDKDGYVMVKVAEPSVWQYKHHVAYGEPVPTGYKVVFLDGNKYNFERDNLQLVSNAELMQRNTMHRYPPELVRLLKTLNKLKKRVANA
ncbi:MAG TPA: HNH endonuclease, partial [Acinetobacter sp.]|nr:HNH endonuclease [Acinetobacter sp.]